MRNSLKTIKDDLAEIPINLSTRRKIEDFEAELRQIAKREDDKSWDEKKDTGGLIREVLGED